MFWFDDNISQEGHEITFRRQYNTDTRTPPALISNPGIIPNFNHVLFSSRDDGIAIMTYTT